MSTNAIEFRGLVKKYPAFQLGPIDLTDETTYRIKFDMLPNWS